MYKAWTISLWPVADVQPRDKYGHPVGHQNCQLDDSQDYADFLPKEAQLTANAMKYATAWNMTPDDVLDMPYGLFNERVMIHKAVTLRKPQYTPQDYVMERTSPRYQKRKRR